MIRVTIEGAGAVRGAREALDEISRRKNTAVVRGMEEGLRWAQTLAQNKYMTAGSGAPNPPPGPLIKRSGKLAKAVQVLHAAIQGDTVVGGLTLRAGIAEKYGWTHEFGGRRTYVILPRKKKILRFIGRDGSVVFAQMVIHPPLRPRPFLRPALEEASKLMIVRIDKALSELARSILSRHLR